ncbi:MAG: NERD domain-containing protein, partial [Lachnospiraceae bacterium]|nr:NERD domain-containing protein [Lachnospiraceae bacterium]
LREQAAPADQKKIDEQIRFAKYGKAGEEKIAFELKNSGMDMYVLHDVYLEFEDKSAQIDYIVITINEQIQKIA